MKKIVYPIIIILMFGWLPGCSKEQSGENVIPADRSNVNDTLLQVNTKWTGDFDGMIERRFVRVLVPFSKTFYFVVEGKQRGITYDMLREFEKYVKNQTYTYDEAKVLEAEKLIREQYYFEILRLVNDLEVQL